MTWASRSRPIAVGDKVAYSAAWLRSTGQFTGDLPHARGTVTDLKVLSADVVLATVDWQNEEIPNRVNVRNLCRVNEKGFSHD